jgi:hypothetical protein
MPSNALEKSAKIPAGPVTKESVPSSSIVVRRSSTRGSSSSLRSGTSGRNAWTASPSSEGIGGEASPASASASSATRVAASMRSPISASVARSMPSGLSQSRRAGIDSVGWNSACSSWTRVDSALSGRNAAMSFSCSPVSLAPSADSGPAAPSHTSRISRGRSQRRRDMQSPLIVDRLTVRGPV